jgi:hypothetical protein
MAYAQRLICAITAIHPSWHSMTSELILVPPLSFSAEFIQGQAQYNNHGGVNSFGYRDMKLASETHHRLMDPCNCNSALFRVSIKDSGVQVHDVTFKNNMMQLLRHHVLNLSRQLTRPHCEFNLDFKQRCRFIGPQVDIVISLKHLKDPTPKVCDGLPVSIENRPFLFEAERATVYRKKCDAVGVLDGKVPAGKRKEVLAHYERQLLGYRKSGIDCDYWWALWYQVGVVFAQIRSHQDY